MQCTRSKTSTGWSLAFQPARIHIDMSTHMHAHMSSSTASNLRRQLEEEPRNELASGDIESQNHRMVRVGRDLKCHLVPPPLP